MKLERGDRPQRFLPVGRSRVAIANAGGDPNWRGRQRGRQQGSRCGYWLTVTEAIATTPMATASCAFCALQATTASEHCELAAQSKIADTSNF
jgi:hypothetical protein